MTDRATKRWIAVNRTHMRMVGYQFDREPTGWWAIYYEGSFLGYRDTEPSAIRYAIKNYELRSGG